MNSNLCQGNNYFFHQLHFGLKSFLFSLKALGQKKTKSLITAIFTVY